MRTRLVVAGAVSAVALMVGVAAMWPSDSAEDLDSGPGSRAAEKVAPTTTTRPASGGADAPAAEPVEAQAPTGQPEAVDAPQDVPPPTTVPPAPVPPPGVGGTATTVAPTRPTTTAPPPPPTTPPTTVVVTVPEDP